jgi:hypothetical protein
MKFLFAGAAVVGDEWRWWCLLRLRLKYGLDFCPKQRWPHKGWVIWHLVPVLGTEGDATMMTDNFNLFT